MTRGRAGRYPAACLVGAGTAVLLICLAVFIIPGIPLEGIFGTRSWAAWLGHDMPLRRAPCPVAPSVEAGGAASARMPPGDALQAIVHPANLARLDGDALRALMLGEIRDWAAVGAAEAGAVTRYTADAETLDRLGLFGEGTSVLTNWDRVLYRVRCERSAIALVPEELIDFRVRALSSPIDIETGDPATPPDTESIVIVGDVMIANWMEAILVTKTLFAGDLEYPFGSTAAVLRGAAICAGNLESPIVRVSRRSMTGLEFGGDPSVLDRMAAAGFDIVSLANNHALNKGTEGLGETMDHLEARSIAYMGAGRNFKDAYSPRVLELGDGTRVAWLGFCTSGRMPQLEDRQAVVAVGRPPFPEHLDAVRRARIEADLVVVFMHWGIEFRNDPNPYQRELAHRFVEAGADLIVGAHPHCVQGIEIYRDSLIVYSLGNFAFGLNEISDRIAASTGGAMLRCRVLGGGIHQFEIIPVLEDLGEPVPLSTSCTDASLREYHRETMQKIYANSRF